MDLNKRFVVFIRLNRRVDGDSMSRQHESGETKFAILSSLFRAYDRCFADARAIPVKSTGMTYLAVSQELMENEDGMTFVRAILRCRDISLSEEVAAGGGCEFQIGLSFGNLAGGVVGATRHLFDVWGETVNRAARVSTISVSSIQAEAGVFLTETDFRRSGLCPDNVSLFCDPVGEFEMKGFGVRRVVLLRP